MTDLATSTVPQFITSLEPAVSSYGYLGVGVLVCLEDFGVPAPGETVLITAAFYAGLGHLNIILVALIGVLGAVLGDNIGFAIGHFGGHPLVERYGKYVFLTPARISTAEKFFNRHGGKIVVVARFIEGLRQLNGVIAGLSEMKWSKFLVFNTIGAVLWVSLWCTIGYLGGNHIQTFLKYQLYFSAAVLIGIVAFIVYKVWQKSRSTKST